MRKTLTALATAATVAVAAVAAPTGAEAHWGGGWGWRNPGLFGGLVVGGLIAGALAPRYYGYPGYYGYYSGYYGPSCWRRHYNGWRWVAYRVC
jgi:hypothetical protein